MWDLHVTASNDVWLFVLIFLLPVILPLGCYSPDAAFLLFRQSLDWWCTLIIFLWNVLERSLLTFSFLSSSSLFTFPITLISVLFFFISASALPCFSFLLQFSFVFHNFFLEHYVETMVLVMNGEKVCTVDWKGIWKTKAKCLDLLVHIKLQPVFISWPAVLFLYSKLLCCNQRPCSWSR